MRRIRRWRFALILLVVSVAVVAAAAAGWRFARTSSAPSNGPIILISIDTLRADHLPLYGYRNLRTPAIDALAAEGVVFDRAYAQTPQTLPSHACILTGLLPFETGVRDNVGAALRADTPMLPGLLKKRGYASGAAVSSALLDKVTGLAQGFDFYDSDTTAPDTQVRRTERAGEETVAVAQKWIASLSSPRFFLFLHLNEPQAPYEPPARFAQYPPYDGEIAHADEVIGRFTKWLKGRGLYDRATILVVSDHGEGLGDHAEQEHGLLLHDDTIRVPLLVKLPRDVNHGHRIAAPVQQIDIVPTILDLLDMPKPAGLRGRSLRALIEGRRAALAAQPLYSEALAGLQRFGWSEVQAITDASFRYVKAPREELYDLRQDPAEQDNVVASHPDVAQAMRAQLAEVVANAGPSTGATQEVSPSSSTTRLAGEDRARLVALGYLGGATDVPPAHTDADAADPKDHVAVFDACTRARRLAGAGRYDEAATVYREVLQKQPDLPSAWLQLAYVLDRSGHAMGAIDSFRKVLAISPQQPSALLGAADVLMRAGRLDEARTDAQRAVTLSPADAHEMLAKIALARNDSGEARQQALLAQQADAASPAPLLVNAMLLYKAGKYEEALPAFEQAVQAVRLRGVPAGDLHYYYADALERLERYGEAEAHFKEELEMSPHSIPARVSLAMLYRAQHRVADAQQAIEDLVHAVPTPEGYAAAARLWTLFGNKERAGTVRTEAKERFGVQAVAAADRPAPVGKR